MTQNDFLRKLSEHLQVKSSLPSPQRKSLLRKILMMKIEQQQREQREREIILLLVFQYHLASEAEEARIRERVMQSIVDMPQIQKSSLAEAILLLTRKTFASVVIAVVLFATFLGPLQTLQPQQLVPIVQAVYLQCLGTVYLNSKPCAEGILLNLSAGDRVRTDDRSSATIFYSDYKVVRLDKGTEASVDSHEKIHVVQGSAWVHSPGKGLMLTTSVVKALIPQGSMGITTRKNFTQLFTETAAVEVQINNPKGPTELLTVLPEKSLSIRSLAKKAQIKEAPLVATPSLWVEQNLNTEEKIALEAEKVVPDSSSREVAREETILDAYNEVNDGNIADAEKILTRIAENGESGTSSDFVLLTDMGDKFTQLQPLVNGMKTRTVEVLKSQTPSTAANQEGLRNGVIGIAYKSEDKSAEVVEDIDKTVRIVGEASR